jgi:DNA primase
MISSPVDEIKSKLDIIEVIGGYIRLQKAGRNYKALCPFHSEKMPSFMVSPEKQMWKCFGCQKGGSIFDFVMEMEGVEFGDALRMLAQRAGVELKKVDPKLKTERSRLYEICDLANRFFIRQLEASQAGKKIQRYLAGRELKPATIRNWQIGYAPNQWQALLDFLKGRKYPEEEILKTGLIVKSERKAAGREYYDRFRDRIIFPIQDLNGVVIGFTGRENPEQPDSRMGKYINTPNTLIYDKSQVIYGLDKAKLDIRKNNLCILVEGQMDVLMAHQADFKNVVASSGTALTEKQLRIIKRYTENLATAFDMDLAGETATKRGIDLAIQLGFNAKVISLPKEQDPADCLQGDSSLWSQAVEKASGLIEFYLENAFSKYDGQTVEGKKEISKILLPVIKKIPNKIEQAHWLQEIARRLKVQEGTLMEELEKIKSLTVRVGRSEEGQITEEEISSDNLNRGVREKPDLEGYTLGLILTNLRKMKRFKREPAYLFTNSELAEIFKSLKKGQVKKVKLKDFREELPTELANRLDELVFKIEAQRSLLGKFEPTKEIRFCFSQLRNCYWKQKLDQLNLSIREAEEKKDKDSLKKLTEEFDKMTKQISLSKS